MFCVSQREAFSLFSLLRIELKLMRAPALDLSPSLDPLTDSIFVQEVRCGKLEQGINWDIG